MIVHVVTVVKAMQRNFTKSKVEQAFTIQIGILYTV